MHDTPELALDLHAATPPWLLVHLREWISGTGDKGHAYLVVSEDPEEASLFAKQLAMQQLCHDLQEGMACRQCQSCKAFLQGTHGDLLLLEVLEGKTAIGIDQIREATHFLQQTALYGATKLLLVRDADQMTLAAANSLLKTLEEPPGNALVLLSSAEAWRLPPTVRSRCQLLRLPNVQKDAALEWLASQVQVTATDAEHLLDMAQGRAVTARLMTDSEGLAAQEALVASFPVLDQQQGGPPAAWSGVDVSVLMSELLAWVEGQVREIDADGFCNHAPNWLLLQRCVAELSSRIKQGATPGKDIVIAELFRLCRSREHAAFAEIGGRFLSSLGREGVAS
jgi:DNA polymerase-3 subunit delta'